LRVNARAYLLLKQLNEAIPRFFSDGAWQLEIKDALRNQEAWLAQYILPHVQRTGVVPTGLFQIQDINREISAFAVERWTGAEDWMAFLEPREREAMTLRFVEDWEYHEIATSQATPIGTVQWRIFNSKKKLAVHLITRRDVARKAA